jgi:O-antigen/teichoic acid export membrane protein
LFGIILYLSSSYLSLNVFHNQSLIPILQIFSLALPFAVWFNLFVSGIRGFQKLKYKVYTESIFLKITTFILIFIFIYFGYGIIGVAYAYLIAIALGAVLAFYYLETKLFPVLKSKIKSISVKKELFHFSWPLMLTALIWTILGYTDTLMLGFFKSTEQVGIYNAALPTAMLTLLVLNSVSLIFMPVTSELFARKKFKELKRIFQVVSKWIFFLTLPGFVALVLFSSQILNILFGSVYTAGALALITLSCGYFISALAGPTRMLLQTLGKTKILLANNIAILVINVILNFYLIPIYGILGAAAATASSLILLSILTLFEVYKYSKQQLKVAIHPFRPIYWKGLLSTVLALIPLYLLKSALSSTPIILLLLLVLYLAAYLVLVKAFKSLEPEDEMVLNALKQVFRRLIPKGNGQTI